MCGCGSGGGTTGRNRYKVTYPDGRIVIKKSLADAELAKAKVPGATLKKI